MTLAQVILLKSVLKIFYLLEKEIDKKMSSEAEVAF